MIELAIIGITVGSIVSVLTVWHSYDAWRRAWTGPGPRAELLLAHHGTDL